MHGVATRFQVLYWKGARRGYVDLVRPAPFEEQVEEERAIRDLEQQWQEEDEHGREE